MEAGTVQDRFELRERLGEGGFGTVYAAWDRELSIPVALKQLRHQSPESIFRFKREFRLLAEVAHPNLVSLFELFQHQDRWYFTMELVPGRHMLDHLRPDAVPVDQAITVEAVGNPRRGAVRRLRVPSPLPELDHLRTVFGQLARALCALHDAGLLHRDVKPSNILVTPDGRVVVLDFGLATQMRPLAATTDAEVVGTPLYMSPEQWVAGQITEASDWYSFGVVLYEALTGIPPFDGVGNEIATNLFDQRPLRARAINPAIPEPLSQLCQDLLNVKPGARPTGQEVLRRLLGDDATLELRGDRRSRAFVGRNLEQAKLRDAFDSVARGRSFVVEVSGETGLGKSALCEHFLAALADDPEALVLSGRSYEQESLPYKALDGVIDELSRVLLRQWHTSPGIWPRDVGDLTRLFPVLGRVPGFTLPAGDDGRSGLEVRRNAVGALRELLRLLGRQQRIVIFLDDVHWGDVDSAVLLHQVLLPPDPPPLLMLLAYRDDDAETSPFLRELHALDAAVATGAVSQRVRLSRIAPDECEQLAQTLMRHRSRPGVIAELAREAAGNPLLLEELVRFAHTEELPATQQTPNPEERRLLLEHMVETRIHELPEAWQRFLGVVGLAARPIDVEIARQVADMPSLDRTLLNRLRTGHLLRLRHTDGREQVAPYHDRIRDIVARSLGDAERKQVHRRLADALAEGKRAAPGLVAAHLYEAGELDRAADYALKAAEQAEAALAFDEAAELYGRALDWRPGDRAPLRKYAEALANAGRCAQAAPRYLEAAAASQGVDALQLRLRACEQHLMGGQTVDGLALLDELCAATRLPRPSSPGRALLGTVSDLVRLKLRGLDFVEKSEAELDPLERFRIDLCYSASRNLLLRDPITATRFSQRALMLALAAGEPSRVVEGMAGVGSGLAVYGIGMGQKMLERARGIADRLGTPYSLGLLRFWSAFVDHTRGRWTQSLAAWEEAAMLLRQCRGVQSEIQKAELNAILAVQLLGRFDELERRTELAMTDARASGNRYTEVYARLYSSIPPLAAGAPDIARERIDEALGRAPEGDHYLRMTALKFEVYCDLYEERPHEALARLDDAWPALEASRTLRLAMVKVVFHGLRAGVLLATRAPGDRTRLARAGDDVEVCAGAADYPYALGQTALLRASLARIRGDRAGALEAALAAERAFAEARLELEVAYARRRRGQLVGGEEGRALVVEADAALRARGIADPERWVATQAPGFPSHEGG